MPEIGSPPARVAAFDLIPKRRSTTVGHQQVSRDRFAASAEKDPPPCRQIQTAEFPGQKAFAEAVQHNPLLLRFSAQEPKKAKEAVPSDSNIRARPRLGPFSVPAFN